MSLRCWTPGLAARCCACYMTGSGGQAWLHRCRRQSAAMSNASSIKAVIPRPSVTHHCYYTFGVATCWLYQHWDHDGVGSTPKCGEPFGLLQPLYKTHYGTWPPIKLQKLLTKFLWQGYISIFRALAKLLSDWGANFESNIIRELWELMGIWKVRTSPYHAQTNGQVEWAHQMLMHMIGKLSKDWKADWPKHLPELVHAYNSTRSAITRYSLTLFDIWAPTTLTHWLLFTHDKGHEKHQHVDHYIAELPEWLWEAFKEAQVQSTSEAERQKWYYDRKANMVLLEPGDLDLAKANAYRGRRKVKDWWEEEPYEMECQVAEGIPSYLMKNQQTGCSWVLHKIDFFSSLPTEGDSSLYGCAG